MIIWFSSGLSLKRFIPPILNFCFPIVILIGVLSLVISPWAIQKAEEYKSGLKSRDEISTLMPGSFKESKSDNRIFYIEGLDEFGKKVKNIFVQTSEKNKIGVIVSKEGERISQEDDADYIVLKKGKRYESTKDSNEFSSTIFDEYGILIEKETPKLLRVGASAGIYEAMPSIDLIKLSIKDTKAKSKYISELMLRVSQPISSLILIFIAIALSYVNPRVGRSLNIITALLIFIIYQNLMGIFQSLISTGKVSLIFGFWPLHFIFIIFAFWLIRNRTNNKPLIPSFHKK